MKLLFNALIKFIFGILLVGLLLFLPAGSLSYTNGWIFAAVLFIPILMLGIILYIKAPELLKKRLDSKEKEVEQKGITRFSAIVFILGFVMAGLDYRFELSSIPRGFEISAVVVFLLSYLLYAEVMRENAYLSRIIEVQENQKVIDTGLYGIVRHPMYMTTVFMFLSIPIILGSWYSFIIFLFYPVLMVARIKNEEKVLSNGLIGYNEYKEKVKYRMIPFIW
ncbi:MAG: isoprenylcysteine carboxylmethyltransferase family protein [Clostridia bacterium]|nr:isoprenylcysteine carboxylmethyltransferase family protein [Clostridia bacterium]